MNRILFIMVGVGVFIVSAMAANTKTSSAWTAGFLQNRMDVEQWRREAYTKNNLLVADIDTLFSRFSSGTGTNTISASTAAITTGNISTGNIATATVGRLNAGIAHCSGSYTVAAGITFVVANASDSSDGALIVTLPALASSHGRMIVVKNISDGDSSITVDANASETIDGAANTALATKDSYVRLLGDTIGTDDWVIW